MQVTGEPLYKTAGGDAYINAVKGLEGFFLAPQGVFGTGAGWADSGFISLVPQLFFASNLTERAIYMFFGATRAKFDAVDPEAKFIISSTGAPALGFEDVRWQLTTKYRAVGESLAGAVDETLLFTQTLATFVANSRQADLSFALDRTKIANGDIIWLNLERLGGDGADNYASDVAVGQSGIVLQTQIHNP